MRLTGSVYTNKKAVSNTLYTGSRAGSRYYSVLENTQATESAQAWSGDVQPGFKNKVTARRRQSVHQVPRPGALRQRRAGQGQGRDRGERAHLDAVLGRGLYRFFSEKFYVGGRYNTREGALAGIADEVKVERSRSAAAGS